MPIADKSIKVFRYDINALRALAILGVLLFHYKIPHFAGGFAGVDVFFVISGYLMSKIIITGVNNGSFSVLDFYGKRVKRIIPALVFVIGIITLAGFFFYFPIDYQLNELNAAASLTFLSNILYFKTTNYFATGADDNILLHTWSLSVEWQFYLLYPFLIIGLNKLIKNKAAFFALFTAVTLAIFLGAIKYTKIDATGSFYLLPSRSWEMFFGGIAFLGEGYLKEFKYKKLFALLGYALIIFCLMFFRSAMPWPGKYTFVPVFATAVVILCNYNNFTFLKHESIQFIGRISYSLYLWHWPLYVSAQYLGVRMGPLSTTVLILLSTGMAYVSYHFVESVPFKSNLRVISCAAACALLAFCFSSYNLNYIAFKPKAVVLSGYRQLRADERREQYSTDVCFITSKTASKLNKSCLAIDAQKHNVLLIGDSHAAQYSASLREALVSKNINLLQATASGCYPFVRPNGLTRCKSIMEHIYKDFIVNKQNKVDGVFLSANWINTVTGKDSSGLIKDLNSTIDYFEKYHIKVIIIGQNETYTMTYPLLAARETQYNISISRKYLNQNAAKMDAFLAKHFKPNYISVYNYGATPPSSANYSPYMSDRNHFSKYGADLTVKRILADTTTAKFLSYINSNTAAAN
ncbi:acyltransferase [Inquilinus sp. KBS0705]|nr:acyltransferase [Inquilinus sp. KBS0705]